MLAPSRHWLILTHEKCVCSIVRVNCAHADLKRKRSVPRAWQSDSQATPWLASSVGVPRMQFEILPDYHDIPTESAFVKRGHSNAHSNTVRWQSPSSEETMRQQAQEPGRERDRLSTLHELGEVIGLLHMKDQLSLSTLASIESEDRRFEGKDLDLWTEADRDRLREAQIDHLTSVILGRSQKFN